MEEKMEENTEESTTFKHPIMIAIENAGFQILGFSCVAENIFDLDRDKTVKKPVLTIRMLPNKECKMYSTAD